MIKAHKNIMVWKSDAFLELANFMYLYRDSSYSAILEMTANVQILTEEIHDYCVHYVPERFDKNNDAYYDFGEEDKVFINQRICDIEYNILETIIYLRKKCRKNEVICELLNKVAESHMNGDIHYFTSSAHREWSNRYQDMVMYHSIHTARVKEEYKHDRKNKQKINIFDPTTWFDIDEPLCIQ